MSRTLKILHTADLHLDSPFEGLCRSKAAIRRGEQRRLLTALADCARRESVDLVLLPGDLLDSTSAYLETGEELVQSLEHMGAPVFIAPGNHDFLSPRSPYLRLKMPENVHIFASPELEYIDLPALGARVYGAGFTEAHSAPLLHNFTAPREDGVFNILCMHADLTSPNSPYNPMSTAELASSGMDYAALGHVHRESGLLRAGQTWYSYPGCPEGRGFDETGEKHVNLIELSENDCRLYPLTVASRRYESISVDISNKDALLAVHAALPDETVRDIYRITLTGETDAPAALSKLYEQLSELFFELQLRDKTRIRQSVWERAGEDSLRGLFLAKLKKLYDEATDDKARERAEQSARWGLAALDGAEEVVQHEDK